MTLIRAVPLKDFTTNPLSTTDVTTGFQLGPLSTGQQVWGAFHLTQQYCATDRVLALLVESATASGFGAPVTRLTFTRTTAIGGELLAPSGPVSTDHSWFRAKWTMSTVASTGGSWKGLVSMGIK